MIYDDFQENIKNKKINKIKAARGDTIKGFMDMNFIVLNPRRDKAYDNENDSSLVIKGVTDNGKSILFCGDIGEKTIKELLAFGNILKADIVKAPHHGTLPSETVSLYDEFYDKTLCNTLIITNKNIRALKGNIIETLRSDKIDIYITGERGAVKVEDRDDLFVIGGG